MLYVFGAGLVLYVAAVAVMSTAWFQRFLLARMTSSLENLTGTRVEIARLDVQPAIFQATLQGLVLHGTELPHESPFFEGQTIVLALNPVSIVRQKLLLRRLDLTHAQVHIYSRPDGSTNVPGPRVQFLDDLLDLSIGTVMVSHSDFFWDNQRLPLEVRARNVAIRLGYDPRQRYSGSVASTATEVETRGWLLPPITFATRLELSRHDLLLTGLSFRISPSTARAGLSGHGWLSWRRFPGQEVEISLQGQGDVSALAGVLRVSELKGGDFGWEGQGSYRNGSFKARGRVQAHQVSVRWPGFASDHIDLTADYAVDHRHVVLPKLTVSLLGGAAQGRAEILLQDSAPRFEFETQLHHLDLTQALGAVSGKESILSHLPLAAHVDGTVDASWRGTFRNASSKFDLVLSPQENARGLLPLSGFARGTATFSSGPLLSLEGAELHTPHSSLATKGTIGESQSNLAIEVTTADFEECRWLARPLSGSSESLPLALKSPATFSGTVLGPISRPEIRGRLTVGPFEYRGWSWAELEGSVVATRDLLQVSHGKLLGGKSALTFEVSAGLEGWKPTPRSRLHLTAQAEGTPLEGLRDAVNAHVPLNGLVTGRLDLEGIRSNLAGSGVLRIEQGTIAQETFDVFSANLRVAGPAWAFEDIQLRKGSGQLTGRASVDPLKHGFSAEVHGTNFSLADIRELAARFQQAFRTQAEDGPNGRMDFDLRGQGTLEAPQLQANVAIRDLRANGTALGDFRGQFSWEAAQMQWQGELQGPGGVLRVKGGAQTKDEWPAQLTVQYANLGVNPWIDFFRGGKLKVAVTSTGILTASGPLKDPERLEVRGRADNLKIGVLDLVWENDRPVELTYAKRVLTISPFRLRGPSTDLEIDGSIHFLEPATLAFTVQGHGDAKLLKALNPMLESTGSFDVKLRVGGSPAQPALSGTLTVKNLSAGYGGLPFRLAGLNGEIQVEGDRLTVRSLRGAGGGGSIEVTGYATLFGNPKFDLRANLNQARIEFPIEITSSLSGNLHLVGTSEGGQLTGEMSVRQMFVSEDFNLLAWMGEFGSRATAPPGPITSALASKIRLNVQVSSDPEVRLESRELSVVATIDLSVQGTAANPVGYGDIHIESGEVTVGPRGDRYKLTRGDITLTNPFRTQVVVDLEAETRVEHYDLTLEIAGPLDHMKFSYRSDPPLPTADIISLLALGYYTREQQATAASRGQVQGPQTSSAQTFSTQGASALLSQALSSQMSGRLRRLFGISQIKIDPNVYGPGVGTGPRVTVEEQVTRDFSLTYSTNTAGAQQRIIHLEYDLSDKVSLIGERDQNGVLGVEVRFRRRFK